ncbi:hypothetical protein HF086_012601 [Spodoptera exigua]|uniref:UDP-glucuronosyltransferase n=1 Tax=Spodoptera exigua TaxID=7107 RepID=A0A922MGY5_SPOEX|nr:hypothetical protein HF086_012601 [Spodoptera exigua]
MKHKIITTICLLSLLISSESLRILVCYPMTSKSHSILGYGVVNRLLEAGHEVVHITSFPNGKVLPNLTEVNVSSIADVFKKDVDGAEAFKLKNLIGKGNFGDSALFLYYVYVIHKNFLEEPSVVKLFSDPKEKFDAVVLEWFFTEMNAGIPALFDCPLIWVCSTEPHWQSMRVMDGITNPAYTLDLFTHNKLPLDFWGRAEGLWKVVKKAVQDLQKLMDEAKNGVIYFSMGSIVQSDGMSEQMQKSILDMFSKYKQTVIWKFESDMKDDIPPNVHLVKWAPQQSILAHPNLKLFITHGGQLSTSEAIHYGIPLVGIPVMADQVLNMISVANKGFGIKVTLSEDMIPELDAAVQQVLTDDAYRKKAKEISALFHDRVMMPGAAVPYWIEYVVRTRGAPHLRSPALNVPLYQKLYLDLAAFLAVVIIILKKAVKYLMKKKTNKKEKSN